MEIDGLSFILVECCKWGMWIYMSDKWAEYRAGTLVPPAVVQHDEVNGEHLIWVWTGENIVGPMSRRGFDEAQAIADALVVVGTVSVEAVSVETVSVEEDLYLLLARKEVEINSLKAEVARKGAEISDFKAAKAKLVKDGS